MGPLYQEHFGLTCGPFNVTPDPGFLYLSASHREALAQLSYGVRARKGFVVLTGEVGTGKTTLIHALLSEINSEAQTALMFTMIENPEDLLRYVCEDFGLIDVEKEQRSTHDYLTLLNRFLLESYRKNLNVALIIDEAQNLTADVLESVRLLSNFETSQDKLLQILLIGQPELDTRLNSPELRQLKQRVTLRYHLRPLSFDECRDYIRSRMGTAGGNISVFTGKALEAVYRYAKGIPRLVNVLCDNGMLTAYALARRQVDADIIDEVADELRLKDAPSRTGGRTSGTSTALASPERPQSREKVPQEADRLPPNSFGVVEVVPRAHLQRMGRALVDAMGPLAPFVMHEHIESLRERAESFPVARWRELVTATSREILDARLKAHFEEQMLALVQRNGKGSA